MLVHVVDLGPRVRLGHRDVLVRGNNVSVATGRAAEPAIAVITLGAR